MNDFISVLIVDDSKSARSFLRDIVDNLGYRVFEAANGREGLELVDCERPDIILTDLEMPEMDGLAFIRELRNNCPYIPVIVISMKSSYADVIEAVRRGAWDYLVKPIKEDDLAVIINDSLERARLLDENCRYRRLLEEQVQAQTQELLESRERYRRLLESVTNYVYTVFFSGGGSTETVHRSGCEKVTGYTVEEYLADPDLWCKIVHEDDRSKVLAMSRNILTESAILDLEHRILHKDGSIRWVSSTLVPCRDKGGAILSYDGIIADITERKMAEESLLHAKKEWERTFDSVPNLIAIIDDRHHIIRANLAMAQRLGVTPEECIDQVCYQIMHGTDHPPPFCPHALTLTDCREHVVEVHEDRLDCDFLVSTTPLMDEYGHMIGTVHVVSDITELKMSDNKLRESERKFKTLFESRRDGLLLADVESKQFKLCNQAMTRMLGYTEEEFRQLSIRDIHPPDDLPYVIEQFEKQVRGELDLATDLPVRRKDGTVFYADISSDRIQLDEKYYLLGSFRDVTDRKVAQEKLKRNMENLTALRNIDNAIKGSLDLRITLKVLLMEALKQLNVDAAVVLLLNPYSQTLEYASEQGFHTDRISFARVRMGASCAGRVAKENKTLFLSDITSAKEGSTPKTLVESEGFKSYVGVPLIAKGNVKGVLELFHRAPLNPEQDWLNFVEALAGQAAIAIDNAELFESLQSSHSELLSAYDTTIEGWSRALDYRDKETEGHSRRVTDLTVRIAREMGIGKEKLIHVRRGALLHDIGKLGVPDNILLKPGKLTEEEFEIMKKHPEIAFSLLSPIEFLRPALDIPHFHHEKWDGSGYPQRLKCEEIPLVARIFSVADVWDALRSDRPYRPAWPEERVRAYISEQAGKDFDPRIVELFLSRVMVQTEMVADSGSGTKFS
jgi:PAS domain S-box-containing protein